MEDKDKRIGWLRELKVGDKIIIYGNPRRVITNINKITPTGRIVVNNTQFDAQGREINGDRWYVHANLHQWTQEEENEIIKKSKFIKMCSSLTNFRWKDCDFELIEKIYDIVLNNLNKEKEN